MHGNHRPDAVKVGDPVTPLDPNVDECGRPICLAAHPWTPERGTPAIHPDAVAGEDRDFGRGEYCASYTCPHCGLHFYVELAQ